jgi:glutamate N-acetyltransferase/amino-acid N-acetyltransferase
MKFARGIFLNGERSLWRKTDIPTVERVCFEVGKGLQCPDEFVLLVTSGSSVLPAPISPLVQGVKAAFKASAALHANGNQIARVIDSDGEGQACAYAFDLGDYPYVIGALYANHSSTACVLTTDVDISAKMLRKALSSAVKDSFSITQISEQCAQNEVVCMIANAAAGNYSISQEDCEYDKFLTALESVLQDVCQTLVTQKGRKRMVAFSVKNAQSKRISRAVVKGLTHSSVVQEALREKRYPFEELLGALCATEEKIDLCSICISVANAEEEFMLYRYGKIVPYEQSTIERILSGEELFVNVDFVSGNYSSTGYCGI